MNSVVANDERLINTTSRVLFFPLFIVIVFFSTTRHKLGRLCKELVEKQESRLPNALLLLFSFPISAIRAVHVGENSFTLVSVTKLSRSKIIRSPFLQAALVMISIEAIASSSPRSGAINSISRRFIIMQQRGIKQNNQKFSFRSLSLFRRHYRDGCYFYSNCRVARSSSYLSFPHATWT